MFAWDTTHAGVIESGGDRVWESDRSEERPPAFTVADGVDAHHERPDDRRRRRDLNLRGGDNMLS